MRHGELTRAEILEWFPDDACPHCGGVTDEECSDSESCRQVREAIDDEAKRRMIDYSDDIRALDGDDWFHDVDMESR